MELNYDLSASAKYLLESVESELSARPTHEILAKAAPVIRTRVRQWWMGLEPEATAGVSVDMMEAGLVRIAQRAATESHRTVSRAWAKQVDWKARVLDIGAEDVIAERFLRTCERLGLLTSRGKTVKFTHMCFLEIYLAVGLLTTRLLPLELRREERVSLSPMRTPGGRAAIALLSLAAPEHTDELFIAVANENLHVATWFLYFNDTARTTHGEWLAAELLSTLEWNIDNTTHQVLQDALLSLGSIALGAARRLIDERAGNLTAYPAAIFILIHHGDQSDIQRLRNLHDEPAIGSWEIERLRQLIRDAEVHVFDEDARVRYEREKGAEVARQTAGFVLKTVGMILAKTAAPHVHWNHEMKQWTAGQAVKGAGSLFGILSNTQFLQQQAALRELLAQLPAQIERRKTQVAAMAPQIVSACELAVDTLSRRGR